MHYQDTKLQALKSECEQMRKLKEQADLLSQSFDSKLEVLLRKIHSQRRKSLVKRQL